MQCNGGGKHSQYRIPWHASPHRATWHHRLHRRCSPVASRACVYPIAFRGCGSPSSCCCPRHPSASGPWRADCLNLHVTNRKPQPTHPERPVMGIWMGYYRCRVHLISVHPDIYTARLNGIWHSPRLSTTLAAGQSISEMPQCNSQPRSARQMCRSI